MKANDIGYGGENAIFLIKILRADSVNSPITIRK